MWNYSPPEGWLLENALRGKRVDVSIGKPEHVAQDFVRMLPQQRCRLTHDGRRLGQQEWLRHDVHAPEHRMLDGPPGPLDQPRVGEEVGHRVHRGDAQPDLAQPPNNLPALELRSPGGYARIELALVRLPTEDGGE